MLIYTLIYRKSLLSVLFEGNVILWLLTRAISLTFWHTANSAESRSSGYCFYILLKNIPAYFMTQAVLILIIQLWGDYRCIEANEDESVIKSVEKKQRRLVLLLSIVNLVITGVCLLSGCTGDHVIAPARFYMAFFLILTISFGYMGRMYLRMFTLINAE